VTSRASAGSKVTFNIKMQNDATVGDTVAVLGCGKATGFKVACGSGGAQITRTVLSGNYTVILAPAGEKDLALTVAVSRTATSGKHLTCPVKATSTGDPANTDTVKATVKVR